MAKYYCKVNLTNISLNRNHWESHSTKVNVDILTKHSNRLNTVVTYKVTVTRMCNHYTDPEDDEEDCQNDKTNILVISLIHSN